MQNTFQAACKNIPCSQSVQARLDLPVLMEGTAAQRGGPIPRGYGGICAQGFCRGFARDLREFCRGCNKGFAGVLHLINRPGISHYAACYPSSLPGFQFSVH